jgi:hypothetical protein
MRMRATAACQQDSGMKKFRVVIVIAAALLLLTSFTYRYFSQHAMKPSAAYERGLPSLPRHVLIATQGSAFKDQLVAGLVAQLEARHAYTKVIDVAQLSGIQERDWQAIVIVHTWEFGKPPKVVGDFASRLAQPGKVVDVTTSGSGREKLAGVDVISSASVVADTPALLMQIGAKIDFLLAKS